MTNSANFPNRPFRLEIRTSINWQDVATNRDSIHTELWIIKNAYSPTFSGGGSSYELWANGFLVASNSNFGFDFTSSDSLRIGTIDYLVEHNPDGTYSFQTAGYCNADVLGYTQVGETITPPTIPRASTATFAGGSTFDAGSTVTINTNRASTGFTHDITFEFGPSKTGTIATGVGASTTWTPPLHLLEAIPNLASANGSITVVTKNGSTVIGSKSTTYTLRAPATVVPTISAVSVADNNPDVTSIVGKLVQGLSAAKVTVTAAGVYGSTITQKSGTVGGVTAAEGTPIPIGAAGTVAVVGVVTDSRGRTASSSGTISVLAYDVPKINAATAQRCSSGGTPQDSGAYLRVDLNAAVSSLVNGTEKNALTITVQTREHGTGAWTTRNTITPGLTHNTFFVVSGGGIFDVAKAWDVRISVADKFLTSQQDLPVGTERVIADFGPNGMGINKRYAQGGLDVGGDIYTDGELRHRGANPVEPVGVIHMFAGATAPAGFLLCDGTAVSRTTYAALFTAIGTAYGVGNGSSTFNLPDLRGRVPTGKDTTTDFDTLGKTGGEKAHVLTVAEMPSHAHPQNVTAGTASGPGVRKDWAGDGSSVAYSQGISTDATGGGGAHNNLAPFLTVNFIIKAL